MANRGRNLTENSQTHPNQQFSKQNRKGTQ